MKKFFRPVMLALALMTVLSAAAASDVQAYNDGGAPIPLCWPGDKCD